MKKRHRYIAGKYTAVARVFAVCMLAAVLALSVAVESYAFFHPPVSSLIASLSQKKSAEVHSLLNDGDYEAALEILEDASDRDPFDDELKEYIAKVYRRQGWELYEEDYLEDGFDSFRRASTYEPEKDAGTYLGLGYGSFRMKNYDDAMYYLYDAVYLDEETPDGHVMLAQIYYLRGRTEEAIQEWELVLELDPENEMAKDALAKAEREYEVEENFDKNETYYFTIKYEGEEKSDLGYEVLDILDRAYGDIGGDLNYYPNEPVTVVLYTEQQFTDVTDAPSWSGGLFDGSIRIPVGGYVNMDRLEIVLYHEYAHYVTLMMSGTRIPTWLAEGIAQREERWVHDGRHYYEYRGPVVDLRLMSNGFTGLSGEAAQMAYMLSLSAVEFYVDTFGSYSLSRLVSLLGEGYTIDEAFVEATSITFDDFQEMWEEDMR